MDLYGGGQSISVSIGSEEDLKKQQKVFYSAILYTILHNTLFHTHLLLYNCKSMVYIVPVHTPTCPYVYVKLFEEGNYLKSCMLAGYLRLLCTQISSRSVHICTEAIDPLIPLDELC